MSDAVLIMSGHCLTPNSSDPQASHERCHNMGGGSSANPRRDFYPCPCPCHFPEERYECGNCGGVLAEAPLWPNEFMLGDDTADKDEAVFTHIDPKTGRATGEECPTKVSRNAPEPEPVKVVVEDDECPDCFARKGSPACIEVCGDDDLFADDEDDFADLADLLADA